MSLEFIMNGGFGFGRFDEDALGRFPQSVVAGRTVAFDFKLPVDRSTVHVTTDRQINFSLKISKRATLNIALEQTCCNGMQLDFHKSASK